MTKKKHTSAISNNVYTRYAHKRVPQLIILMMAALFIIIDNHGSNWTWFKSLNDNIQMTIQCTPIIVAIVVSIMSEIKD